jgi:hypothetical protein
VIPFLVTVGAVYALFTHDFKVPPPSRSSVPVAHAAEGAVPGELIDEDTSLSKDNPAFVLAAIDHGGTDGVTESDVQPYADGLAIAARACHTSTRDVADLVAFARRTSREKGGPNLRVGDVLDGLVGFIGEAGSQLGGLRGCQEEIALHVTLAVTGG